MDETSRETDALVKDYAAIEALGAEILTEKSQMVSGDEKRNKCREALRAIEKDEKGEQEIVTEEIDSLRSGLKSKVAQLHKMEGRAECKGFELKGIKLEDILISKN